MRDSVLRLAGAEQGGVLPFVALSLPVLILFSAFVLDVGNWFVHKRHLQLQADAAALAGGGKFRFPCDDEPIVSETRKYGGDPTHPAPYNQQIGGIDQNNVHLLINSLEFWNDGGTDYSDGGSPCTARMVDVKITEADLPWLFDVTEVVPAINAHARVQVQTLQSISGSLPVGVPDVDPKTATATFFDETTGAVLASTPLTKTGVVDGLAIWDNSASPLSVGVAAQHVGVRIALSGSSSTTCGQPLVECYDAGTLDATGTPTKGILYARGWSSLGSADGDLPPIAGSVTLFPSGLSDSCPDPYFSSASFTCTIGVAAKVRFGVDDPTTIGARVTAKIVGTNSEKALTYDASSGEWRSTSPNYFSISPQAGPISFELKWEETSGTQGGNTCTTGGGNKCKGTFGVVQRTFAARDDRSGPIKLAQVWESGAFWANSFELGTTYDLVVKIGVQGNLANAASASDPIVYLRVTGSQNQSVDCDPAKPNLRDELATGCAPEYTRNEGSPCPATATLLWSSPQPWNCTAIQTGGAVGQVSQGMNDRVHGGASTCVSPNNWAKFPNIEPDDPRIVPVFLTPFGSFSGSGNAVVSVSGFATFYVTGWDGDPCTGATEGASDPVPGKGYIAGHFWQYVYALNNGGGGDELCDFESLSSCIAVLVE